MQTGDDEISSLSLNLDHVPSYSAPGESAYNWQSKWVGIIAIRSEKKANSLSSDVLVAVESRRHSSTGFSENDVVTETRA